MFTASHYHEYGDVRLELKNLVYNPQNILSCASVSWGKKMKIRVMCAKIHILDENLWPKRIRMKNKNIQMWLIHASMTGKTRETRYKQFSPYHNATWIMKRPEKKISVVLLARVSWQKVRRRPREMKSAHLTSEKLSVALSPTANQLCFTF